MVAGCGGHQDEPVGSHQACLVGKESEGEAGFPRITSCGVLSIVVGCKNLRRLHLIRCLNVASVEWLEYFGKLEILEELWIKNCIAIGEGDLIKLGNSWRKLRSLRFEVDANYRYMKVYDRLAVERWQKQLVPCDNLVELGLCNCIIASGRGLACVLRKCKSLDLPGKTYHGCIEIALLASYVHITAVKYSVLVVRNC